MVPIKFLNKQEKEKLIKQLNEQFGIREVDGQLAKFGKERIVLFSGDAIEKEIIMIDELARIEGVGLYIAKEQPDGIRLSIEGSQLIGKQATKNVFEMNEKQAEQWMLGQEILTPLRERGFTIMKFKDDFLGTGKASEGRITNFVPKARRLKFKETPIVELTKEQEESVEE
jgi:NOL1/NOP2/fmu family ribosome biogenesis protein